jgi:hypothetical protein
MAGLRGRPSGPGAVEPTSAAEVSTTTRGVGTRQYLSARKAEVMATRDGEEVYTEYGIRAPGSKSIFMVTQDLTEAERMLDLVGAGQIFMRTVHYGAWGCAPTASRTGSREIESAVQTAESFDNGWTPRVRLHPAS